MKLRGPGSSGNAEMAEWSSQHSRRKTEGAIVVTATAETVETQNRKVKSWSVTSRRNEWNDYK